MTGTTPQTRTQARICACALAHARPRTQARTPYQGIGEKQGEPHVLLRVPERRAWQEVTLLRDGAPETDLSF